MYNYNINPINMNPYMQGKQNNEERERLQGVEDLRQRVLSGDQEALQEYAMIDPRGASVYQSMNQPAEINPADAMQFAEDARAAFPLIKSGGEYGNLALNNLSAQYANTPFQSAISEFSSLYSQNPEIAIEKYQGFVDQLPVEEEKKKDIKVGRYRTEKLNNKVVLFDSATSDVVREWDIPESKKDRETLRKTIAQANKAESEAELSLITAESNEQKKMASLDMLSEASIIARDLSKDKNLDQAVGNISTMLPTLRGSTQDVINKAQRLESLLTVDNLKLMSGVLTDRDIAFLTRVASGINITDSGIKGSLPAVQKRLIEIADKIDSKISSQKESNLGGGSNKVANWSDAPDE